MMFEDGVSTAELYENAPCGCLSVLPDGLIIKTNATLCLMLGYKTEELVRKVKWQNLLSMGGKIYHETHYAPLMRMQKRVQEVNFDFVKKDGNRIPVVVNAVEMKSDESSYINMIVYMMNQRKQYEKELMTAKKEAEDLVVQLAKKNEELDKFAYIVSHDLKAPLNNIIGLSDILAEDFSKLGSDEQEILMAISASAQKLKLFIDDILAYYKGNKTDDSPKDSIDFTLFCHELLNLLNPNQEHQITFPKNNPIIYAHKIILEQIYINLLANSIKYNDKEKVIINIDYSENEQFYTFVIKDNGIGISVENQEKIFQLFTNLGKKDRHGDYGTGIGLSTIKNLVETQGGNIRIDSTLGEGTTFYFTFKK
jgi:PAS domain S-box-containing protein